VTSRAQRVVGAVLVAAGAAVGLEASTFDVGFLTDPVGPKALPYLVAATLVLAGLHAVARPGDRVRWPTRSAAARITTAAVAFVLYAVALPLIGFFLATTLVVATLSHLYGAPPLRGISAAATLSAVLWLLFVRLLSLPLPIGDLWIR